jgi:hypothetical protein
MGETVDMGSDPDQRWSSWEYYDRRVAEGVRGLGHAHAYWSGLGVSVDVGEIAGEAAEVERQLRALEPEAFIEVGCGRGPSQGCWRDRV